jgi:hypothetical protein
MSYFVCCLTQLASQRYKHKDTIQGITTSFSEY